MYVHGNPTWERQIYWPIETAIFGFRDVIDLLVNLGADYNRGIAAAYQNPADSMARKSILDAVRGILVRAKEEIADKETKQVKSDAQDSFEELAALDGWKGALGKHLLEISKKSEEGAIIRANEARRKMIQNLADSVRYLTKVEELLTSHGAKSWKDLHSDDDCEKDHSLWFNKLGGRYGNYQPPQTKLRFFRMIGGWCFESIPTHLVSAYDELFIACCEGDNAKIEELCLPKDGKANNQVLQITVSYGESWGK